MKKILFFDKLDYFSILIIFFLKIFYKKIYFRDANDFFKKKNNKNFLIRFNIFWISHLNLDCKYYNESISIRRELEKKFINNQIKDTYLTKNFSKIFDLDENKLNKYYLSLRGELLHQGEFLFESSSITLIKKFFLKDDFDIIYFPKDIISYLISIEYNNPRLKVNSFYCFYVLFNNIFKRVFFGICKIIHKLFLMISFKKYKSKLIEKSLNLLNYKFAYFPHKGLRYGNSYLNTFVYDKDPTSQLYKKKVLTLFFEDTDKVSKRFMEIHGIPHLNINSIISKKEALKNTLLFYCKIFSVKKFIKNINIKNFFILNFHFNFLFSINKYLDFLKKTENLKLIYSSYDVLFPKTLKFACELKKIKTISHQERLYHYSFFSPLFYNYYLVSGEFRNLLPKYEYLINDEYINIGVIRSNLIKTTISHQTKTDLINLRKIKNKKKIVLCIGLFALDDHESGIIGEDGTSIKSNIDFVSTILRLSQRFETLYFVIRLKDKKTLKYLSSEIIDKIKNSSNIEINENHEKVNIYQIAYLSDFIIGKQTSVMEETISAGKQVIFYDNENHFNSLDYILNKYDLSEKNYSGLENRLNNLLSGINVVSYEKSNLDEYFSVKNKIDSYKVIKGTIINIIENEK